MMKLTRVCLHVSRCTSLGLKLVMIYFNLCDYGKDVDSENIYWQLPLHLQPKDRYLLSCFLVPHSYCRQVHLVIPFILTTDGPVLLSEKTLHNDRTQDMAEYYTGFKSRPGGRLSILRIFMVVLSTLKKISG
jgi:hypothetical protein